MYCTVLFDSSLKTHRGKRIPYYDEVRLEREVKDKELAWFHVGYGCMCLYRLLQVDNVTFIAENIHHSCYTDSPDWTAYASNPELALKEY